MLGMEEERKPAVGAKESEAPPAPPANTGKPKKPRSRVEADFRDKRHGCL